MIQLGKTFSTINCGTDWVDNQLRFFELNGHNEADQTAAAYLF